MSRRILFALAGMVALILVLAGGAWWWMQSQDSVPDAAGVSPETAAVAEGKLRTLEDGSGDSVTLSAPEVTSLIRYRAPAWVRNTVVAPAVQLEGDTVRMTGLLPTDRLPSDPQIDQMRMLLPDSARLDVVGVVFVLAGGETALELVDVQLAGIPIPARYYPEILRRLNQPDTPGLPEDAVLLPLPEGVSSVRVRDGELILIPQN